MAGTPERRFKLRATDVAARSFKDETVVLDLRSSTYLSTNPSGTLLWRELERGTTRSALVRALLEEFEVSEQRAASDVDACLADCERRGLLSGEEAPSEEESR